MKMKCPNCETQEGIIECELDEVKTKVCETCLEELKDLNWCEW